MGESLYKSDALETAAAEVEASSQKVAAKTDKALAFRHAVSLRNLLGLIKKAQVQDPRRRLDDKYVMALCTGLISAPELLVYNPTVESTLRQDAANFLIGRRMAEFQRAQNIEAPQRKEAPSIGLALATIGKVDERVKHPSPVSSTFLTAFERTIVKKAPEEQKAWAEVCRRIEERIAPPTI